MYGINFVILIQFLYLQNIITGTQKQKYNLSLDLQVVTTCVSAIVHSKSKCRCYYFLPMCHVTNQSGARAKLRINGEMHRLEIFFIIFVPFFCCIILKPKQCTRKMVIKYIEQIHKKIMQFFFALFWIQEIGTKNYHQKYLIFKIYSICNH